MTYVLGSFAFLLQRFWWNLFSADEYVRHYCKLQLKRKTGSYFTACNIIILCRLRPRKKLHKKVYRNNFTVRWPNGMIVGLTGRKFWVKIRLALHVFTIISANCSWCIITWLKDEEPEFFNSVLSHVRNQAKSKKYLKILYYRTSAQTFVFI